MHRRERVIVTDIESDPLWQDYREVALPHNLRACWSTPIFSDQGQVLGSFALYYHEPRSPTAEEIRLIDIATQLATIAIERKRVDAEVHEQRTALAHLGRVAMLGELSGALAHELAQPLTAVLSNAQAAQRLLDRDPPDIEQVREILEMVIGGEFASVANLEWYISELRRWRIVRGLRLLSLDFDRTIDEMDPLDAIAWMEDQLSKLKKVAAPLADKALELVL